MIYHEISVQAYTIMKNRAFAKCFERPGMDGADEGFSSGFALSEPVRVHNEQLWQDLTSLCAGPRCMPLSQHIKMQVYAFQVYCWFMCWEARSGSSPY